jgi:hypothetical protein
LNIVQVEFNNETYTPGSPVSDHSGDEAYGDEEMSRHQHEHLTNPNIPIRETARDLEAGRPVDERRLETFYV